MVNLTIDENKKNLIIHLSVFQKILSVQGDLIIPLKQIKSCSPSTQKPPLFNGFRVGCDVPGIIKAGNFYHFESKTDFYYTTFNEKYSLKLEVDTATHRIIHVDVNEGEDVNQVAKLINDAVQEVSE